MLSTSNILNELSERTKRSLKAAGKVGLGAAAISGTLAHLYNVGKDNDTRSKFSTDLKDRIRFKPLGVAAITGTGAALTAKAGADSAQQDQKNQQVIQK